MKKKLVFHPKSGAIMNFRTICNNIKKNLKTLLFSTTTYKGNLTGLKSFNLLKKIPHFITKWLIVQILHQNCLINSRYLSNNRQSKGRFIVLHQRLGEQTIVNRRQLTVQNHREGEDCHTVINQWKFMSKFTWMQINKHL